MKKSYIYFFASSIALLAAGCDNSGNELETPARKNCPDFSATIGRRHTRAFDRSWETGDLIGISGAGRENVCYITKEGNGIFSVYTVGDQIYFPDDGDVIFNAYYPWTQSPSASGEITADTKLQNNQKSFDFLWDQAAGKKDAPEVNFSFAHMMSKLSLTIRPGEAMSFDEVKNASLSLSGLIHTGTFNIKDGAISIEGNSSDIWSFSEFARENDNTLTFSFILFPQVLASPLVFSADLDIPDNGSYHMGANIDFTGANREIDGADAKNELVVGRQYNLNITLHKSSLSINDCGIDDWTSVIGDEISAE